MTAGWAGRVSRRRRRIPGSARFALYLLTIMVLVAIWWLVTATGIAGPQVLAGPGPVLSAARSLAAQGQLWPNVGDTALRILASVLMGCVAGVLLGSLLWRIPVAWSALRQYLAASYAVPLVVFYPTLLVLLGINDWPIVLLTTVMTTIPVALNTTLGLHGVAPVLVHMSRTTGRGPARTFWQVRLPAAWPAILGGIKLSVVYGVVGVVAMEFLAGNSGLGNAIQANYEQFNVPAMDVSVVAAVVLSAVFIGAALLLEVTTSRGHGGHTAPAGARMPTAAAGPAWPTAAAAARTAVRLLVVPVAIVVIWYILSLTIFVVPSPASAVQTLASGLGQPAYLSNVLDTLGKVLLAFVIGAVIGIALGALLGLVRPLRVAFEPLVLILNGIPKIVFYPMLLIIFGLQDSSQVTMGVIFGALPVLVNVMTGLAAMPPVYRKLARTMELPWWKALTLVYLRSAVPVVMVALQMGFSLSMLGVVYGELIAAMHGIGQTLIQAYSAGTYPLMSSAILVIVIIALIGVGLLRLLERAATPHPGRRGRRHVPSQAQPQSQETPAPVPMAK